MDKYTLIDFGLSSDIYNQEGKLKPQRKLSNFFGNFVFASEDMIDLKRPCRKSDFESLINLLSFLHSGNHPLILFKDADPQTLIYNRRKYKKELRA